MENVTKRLLEGWVVDFKPTIEFFKKEIQLLFNITTNMFQVEYLIQVLCWV